MGITSGQHRDGAGSAASTGVHLASTHAAPPASVRSSIDQTRRATHGPAAVHAARLRQLADRGAGVVAARAGYRADVAGCSRLRGLAFGACLALLGVTACGGEDGARSGSGGSGGGCDGSGASCPRPRYPVRFQLVDQGAPTDAEQRRRAGLIASGALEGVQDLLFLQRAHGRP